MELKILKHAAGLTETIFHGKVLEKNVSASDLSGIGMLHVYLHNIEESISEEILPQIKKHELGQIINCTSASPYLYFTSVFYQENEAKQGTISVIRYDSVTQNMESVYSFDDDISKYGSDLKLNLWILSDTYLFLQKEYLVRNSRNTYSGFMRFEISLVNLKDGGRYDILDEKIVKNGIADILQFSENQCVIKTGFCLLDELRYQELTEEEASLEAVSIVNIGQMASDLVLVQDQVVLNTLDQAFFTTTIPYIKLTGNYLIYSCVNLEKKQEEIKFME